MVDYFVCMLRKTLVLSFELCDGSNCGKEQLVKSIEL